MKREIDLRDPQTAYSTQALSPGSYLFFNLRDIDMEQIRRKSFNTKYPEARAFSSLVQRDAFMDFELHLIELLTNEAVAPSEVLRKILAEPENFLNNPKFDSGASTIDTQAIEQAYAERGVDIHSVIQETINAVKAIIEELPLPTAVRAGVCSQIDSLDLVITHDASPQADFRERKVSISLNWPRIIAGVLEKYVPGEVSQDLLRLFLIAMLAHEIGHLCDALIGEHAQFVISGKISELVEADDVFPITYENKTDNLRLMNNQERWATFFEYATVGKIGLSTEAIEDKKRLALSFLLDTILGKVTPNRLSQFLEVIEKELEQGDVRKEFLVQFLEDIVSGHTISQCYPLTLSEVQRAIHKGLNEL